MNSKIFTHFMNKIDNLSEVIYSACQELDQKSEDIKFMFDKLYKALRELESIKEELKKYDNAKE